MFKFITKGRFESLLSEQHTRSFMLGMEAQLQASSTLKAQKTDIEKKALLNKIIIGVSNEYGNPVIGKVINFVDLSAGFAPIVKDFISGQSVVFMGAHKLYTPQLFKALMKLEPEERAALMFKNLYPGLTVSFDKELPCAETILTPQQLTMKLVQSGFDPDIDHNSLPEISPWFKRENRNYIKTNP